MVIKLPGLEKNVTADSKDDDIFRAVLHYLRTAKPKVL